MLECAIPGCCGREKFLRSGTLHLIDMVQEDGSIAKRMVWLCAKCTPLYTVQMWRTPGEQVRPRGRTCIIDFAEILASQGPRLVPAVASQNNIARHAIRSTISKRYCAAH